MVLWLHSHPSIIISTFNCYCWTSITMEFIYLSRVSRPLNVKGQPTHDRSHVALIAQLGEHCTGNAKVVDGFESRSKPERTFSGHFPGSVMTAFASIVNSVIVSFCFSEVANTEFLLFSQRRTNGRSCVSHQTNLKYSSQLAYPSRLFLG